MVLFKVGSIIGKKGRSFLVEKTPDFAGYKERSVNFIGRDKKRDSW